VTWLQRYRLRDFVRSSFWIMPACALVCAVLLARFLRSIDDREHWQCLNFTLEGAKAILSSFIASLLTFIVVVCSSLLLVVQLVSSSLTPRIIAPTFRHFLIRLSLSLFVFVYVLSIKVLARLTEPVPQFTVAVAIGLNVFSLILFLHFVGAVGMALRPIQIMAVIAKRGRAVIYEIYPSLYDSSDGQVEAPRDLGAVRSVVQYEGASGTLLAFDATGLVTTAREHGAVIELVPRVGDYVAGGEPLFRIYGSDSIEGAHLRRMVALGPERTLEQDPRFAFRIIVDIACKALSPAINDPTTAVLALDQLHRLLRWVGSRKLLTGSQTDSAGAVRLVFSTPKWEDFIWLGTAEIRHYGADSIRVCQRLCSMFQHLIQILPEARRPPLELHLRMLNETIDQKFPQPDDRMRIRKGAAQSNGAAADA
jgi:uncharacterized membrane protein